MATSNSIPSNNSNSPENTHYASTLISLNERKKLPKEALDAILTRAKSIIQNHPSAISSLLAALGSANAGDHGMIEHDVAMAAWAIQRMADELEESIDIVSEMDCAEVNHG